ncbi:MAG TPA: undecaprenyl-diphosphatase UppP [Kofleriaceae bacterium]|jgi:undecaprenyl-diphosphatase
MALWFAALLGLIQGLTEFIPVSSTAHLRVAGALAGQGDAGAAYTAVIQLGTLAAVIVYFARDLWSFPQAAFKAPGTPEGRLPWMIIAGTVPIVVVGLLFKSRIENELRSLYIIGGALVLVGIVMWVIDRHAGTRPGRSIATLSWADAMLIGGAQVFALVPGVSRSGSTICVALLLGLARPDAARFSFLLSIPAVAGAGILEARKAFVELGSDAVPALAVGVGVAAIVGYASISWFMKFLGTHQLTSFAVYRIGAGLALLAALVTKVL